MHYTPGLCKGQKARVIWYLGTGLKAGAVNGIEPSSSAWKAVALPLSYTRE